MADNEEFKDFDEEIDVEVPDVEQEELSTDEVIVDDSTPDTQPETETEEQENTIENIEQDVEENTENDINENIQEDIEQIETKEQEESAQTLNSDPEIQDPTVNSLNNAKTIAENIPEDLSPWEELDDENSVVKKYIVLISKDFIPIMDSMSTDKRSAYINDAIQKKIDIESEKKEINKKRKLISHIIVMAITFILVLPIALLVANKAIMATFENYKYSQDNFEKLYKSHFEKSKIYNRSVKYNKDHDIK